jgi:hypothetical protein
VIIFGLNVIVVVNSIVMCRKCQVDNCSCNSVISKSGEKGDRGTQGFSAYQIAVANGFVGTETEWLASLAGGTFLALSDTPNTYEGQAGRVPTVNEDEDGLDFTVLPVELTTDELAAINGANTPNALNVFATINDVPTLVSELTNDSGFITSAPNIYNTDDSLTGNREVDTATYTLKFKYDASNDLTYSQNFTTQRTASGSFGGYIAHNDNGNQAKVALRAGSSGVGFLDSKDRLIINANWDGNSGSTSGYSGGSVNSIVIGNVFSNGNVGFGWNPNVGIPYRVTVDGTLACISPSASSLDVAFRVRNFGSTLDLFYVKGNGVQNYVTPVYIDNAAALVGGLVVGDQYKTATGIRMEVY